jgi:hypothetical protein
LRLKTTVRWPNALFRLAFASAPGVLPLNLATKSNSLAHSPKGTRLGCGILANAHRPPTACKHTVSGSFHSGHPGSFHLSLAVLVHYRSLRIFSLGDWTPLLPTGLACPVVLKLSTRVRPLSGTGLSPSLAGLPSALPLDDDFVTPWSGVANLPILSTPSSQRLHAFMSRV